MLYQGPEGLSSFPLIPNSSILECVYIEVTFFFPFQTWFYELSLDKT